MTGSQAPDLNHFTILPFCVYIWEIQLLEEGLTTASKIKSCSLDQNSQYSHYITSVMGNILGLRSYFIILMLLKSVNKVAEI